VRITHLGHACLLLETAGARLLVDPGTYSSGWEELTGLDAVLVTHAHPDHVDTEKLPQLLEANDGVLLRVEPELAASLKGSGLDVAGAEVDLAPLHPGEHLDVAGVRVRAVGGTHAQIHRDVPRIGNVGLLVSAPGEPVLFHPGDAYDVVPEEVDVLALPLNAPWTGIAATVDFLRAVRPSVAVPVHDALLSATGRATYTSRVGALAPEGTRISDTGGRGALEV
jgi:L-ascorbate metabolism protein UlaG (beta-lactamase superfamily)